LAWGSALAVHSLLFVLLVNVLFGVFGQFYELYASPVSTILFYYVLSFSQWLNWWWWWWWYATF